MIANKNRIASHMPESTQASQETNQHSSLNEARPTAMDGFVGQSQLKALIRTSTLSSKKQNRPFPHALLTGSAGLGKTTLAQIIAVERGVDFIPVNAADLSSPESLQKIMCLQTLMR